MNLIFYLFGRNYREDPIASSDKMKEALSAYSDMRNRGVQARLIISREYGALTLKVKAKSEIGIWEKVENFFFGTYDLLNVKTLVERALGELAKPQDPDVFKKIEHTVTLLNGPLKVNHGTEIQTRLLQALAPLSLKDESERLGLARLSEHHMIDTSVERPNVDSAKLQNLKSKHEE